MNPRTRTARVLAIDIGTSSLRTALFDSRARRLMETTAQRRYRPRLTADGGFEHDPAALRRAFLQCLDQTLRGARGLPAAPIIAVGTSAYWHSLLGVDRQGRALTPIYTWADTRARHQAARLRRRLVESRVHARTGCMLHSSFWPAKLLWLRRQQPRTVGRVARWVSPVEWLFEPFCQQRVCPLAIASATGLFNQQTLDWDPPMLRVCGIDRDALNPVSLEPLSVTRKFLKRFPGLKSAAWFPAIGDGAAGSLGSDAAGPGRAAINYGTSAAARLICRGDRARAPFGLFCYRLDRQRYVVGGATSNAGNLLDWCRRELNLPAKLRWSQPPSHGLMALPFWAGERAPDWRETLRGAITGLTHATTARDIAQAVREATFQQLARIIERLTESCGAPLEFVVAGPLGNSRADLQLMADVLGRPLRPSPDPEASLRGAAVYALQRCGIQPPPLPARRGVRPRKSPARFYAMARDRQRSLRRLLERFAAL
jgi:gluconokinase